MRARWLILCLGWVACGDPCKDLASRYCACAALPGEVQACQQRISSQVQQQSLSRGAQGHCADLLTLGQCTCQNLAKGNLAACGLTTAVP